MDRIKIEQLPGRGQGVLANCELTPNDIIYEIDELAISAISTGCLKNTCYCCLAGSKYKGDDRQSLAQDSQADLKLCTGCQIAHFCSKNCQAKAWKKFHKYECKIFARLHPRILPEAVRAIVRFVLQHKYKCLAEGLWEMVFALISHLEERRATAKKEWNDLLLMAKAAASYSSAANEETCLQLLCILKTNAMTLQTTTNDAIGMFLDPCLSRLNHSCDANMVVYRPLSTYSVGWQQRDISGKHMLIAFPVRNIVSGEELTIAYVDFLHDVQYRQAELQQNYLFKCVCPQCLSDVEREEEVARLNPELAILQKSWQTQFSAYLEAISTEHSDSKSFSKLVKDLTNMAQSMESWATLSPAIDPYPRIIQELKLQNMVRPETRQASLICAFKQYLVIDPYLHKSKLSPARVVNAIYLIKALEKVHQTSHEEIKLGYWRFRVAMEMGRALAESGARDLSEYFWMEAEAARGRPEVFGLSLEYSDVETQAEDEVRVMLQISRARWETVRRIW